MPVCYLGPDPLQSTFFIPGGAVPASGGQLFFYVSGTSTKQTVYKDNAGAVAWSNPLVLDSGGNLPSGGTVWFPTGNTYTVKFCPATDTDPPTSPYWTHDNLTGMNDVAAQTGAEWVPGPVPTFINGTSFAMSGDQTATFQVGRRVKTTNSPAGTVYGQILSAGFATGSTTVNVTNSALSMDSGLSAVAYGTLSATNPSYPEFRDSIFRIGNDSNMSKQFGFTVSSAPVSTNTLIPVTPAGIETYRGADIAASSTINLDTATGQYLYITGTNAINSVTLSEGRQRLVKFTSTAALNNSTSFILPYSLNITTQANDTALLVGESSGTVRVVDYGTGVQTAATGASLVYLTTRAAANTSALWFTANDFSWTNYDEYEFHMFNMKPSVNSPLFLTQFSEDNGASFKTANYTQAITFYNSGNTEFRNQGSTTYVGLTDVNAGVSANAFMTLSMKVRFVTPWTTTFNKYITMTDCTYVQASTGQLVTGNGTGLYSGDQGAVNGILFGFSAGVISSGTIRVYALKKS
jgi:hypothetical protein